MGQLLYFELSRTKLAQRAGVKAGYWNQLYAYADSQPTGISDPYGLGIWDWILDWLKEKSPEETTKASASAILAQGCIAANCKRHVTDRSELEAQGDCISILNQIMTSKGGGALGFIQPQGGIDNVVAECAKQCSEQLKSMKGSCGCSGN
jgi:hypothetical protein